MNTKISDKQEIKIRETKPDKAIMPGPAYFVILTVTIILLLSFTIAFFAVFARQSSGNDLNDIDGDQPQQDNSIGSGGNQTVPKKSNYISKSAAGVQMIGDQINSENVILVDIDKNESIAEKGADDIIYPASMTKVMSLLVACENAKNLNKRLTVSQKTIDYAYSMGGSLFGVKRGDELTVKDLLYLTSYFSDTVAILMLAEHIAGSEAKFVELMNEKVDALHLKNTHFDNCTGLFSENNYSTCREMAAIMAYALENSFCKKLLTSTEAYKITEPGGGPLYTLRSPSWYSQRLGNNPKLETVTVKGGKTGFIDESGYCLLSYAEGESGRRYIQVVIGDKLTVINQKNKIWSANDVKFVYNNYAN